MKRLSGFTLVEILVVISIIGALTALVLVSYTGPQKQARDSQRKSDLKQYQSSLEVFANKTNGLYPSRSDSAGAIASIALCTDLEMTGCSEDPRNAKDSSFVYRYQSDGSGADSADATQYVLWGKLENKEDYWVLCSNGKVGAISQASWSNPSEGNCPL
jgi:prepilin-type N-terminal cleavage/methylation domain-containing protein